MTSKKIYRFFVDKKKIKKYNINRIIFDYEGEIIGIILPKRPK